MLKACNFTLPFSRGVDANKDSFIHALFPQLSHNPTFEFWIASNGHSLPFSLSQTLLSPFSVNGLESRLLAPHLFPCQHCASRFHFLPGLQFSILLISFSLKLFLNWGYCCWAWRFWFCRIWSLITSTLSTLRLGLTTSFFRSSLGREHCVLCASSLAIGSCFCSQFLLLATMPDCKLTFSCFFARWDWTLCCCYGVVFRCDVFAADTVSESFW